MPEIRSGLFCFCILYSQVGSTGYDWPRRTVARKAYLFVFMSRNRSIFGVVIASRRGGKLFVKKQ